MVDPDESDPVVGAEAGATWSIEQVVAFVPTSARFGAGEAVAVPSSWSPVGASERAVWGRYHGSGAEPYEVMVDHVGVTSRCSCPSRRSPCKHVVGLLVLWVRGHVAAGREPAAVSSWLDRTALRRAGAGESGEGGPGPSPIAGSDSGTAGADRADDGAGSGDRAEPAPDGSADREHNLEHGRNERMERLRHGLVELDRWIDDRLRAGLADPSIARFATWDELAARLTDARAGSLANRVRRLAGKVGSSPDWHEQVLAELGVLHLLARAGQRVPELPPDLADAVAVACGWQVRSADVAASAPETDDWLVVGRSDTREDLVEVRRVWLRGVTSGRWAMVLSFAAYRQSLDASLRPGHVVTADVHRYPGSQHRVIVGERHGLTHDAAAGHAAALSGGGPVAAAFDDIGAAFAAEPWLDRVPALLTATPSSHGSPWALTDATGAMVLASTEWLRADAVGELVVASSGRPVTVAVEWTPAGAVPLTVFLADRILDIGPRADLSFVGAA